MSQISYKAKIQNLKEILSQGLLEKEEIIGLVLLCMVAGKSIFLYGPPGTAKSLISRRVSCAFKSNKFFDYLMNRFSTPEEVFGPLKLSELRQDRLVRNIDGFLPSADFAFLDEIWKSSPAILNALLTIINEKKFRNGEANIDVPLRGLVAASNELPQKGQSLEALYDRFIMRVVVPPLQKKQNFALLLQGLPLSEKIDIPSHLLFDNDELQYIKNQAKTIKINNEAMKVIELLRASIAMYNDKKPQEIEPIYVSDRRWLAVVELLKFSALLNDREFVELSDLGLLKYCLWSDENHKEDIAKMLKECITNSQDSSYKDKYETLLAGLGTNPPKQTTKS
ncbi:AAA family ATPase [Helicobacter sp. T3_23-1059]